MNRAVTLSSLALILLMGCGPSSEDIANGAHHTCVIRSLLDHLEENPGDEEAMDNLRERRHFIEGILERDRYEGQRAAVLEEINAKADEECPR